MTTAALPGWAADLPPAPTLRGVARRIGWRGVLDGVVPVVLFVLLDGAAGLLWAMVAVTGWTVGVAGWRLRTGRRTGPLLWLATGYALLRGLAGVLSGSPLVFFGPGVVQTGLVGLAFLGSVAVGRPLTARIAQLVYPFPAELRAHAAYRRAFRRLTLLWGGWLVLRAGLDVWLLLTVDPSLFVALRAAVGLPVLAVLAVVSLRWPARTLRRDPELAAVLDAVEERHRAAAGAPVTVERVTGEPVTGERATGIEPA